MAELIVGLCGPVQTVRLVAKVDCPDPLRDLDLSGVFNNCPRYEVTLVYQRILAPDP